MPRSWYEISAQHDGVPEIFIYDEIGFFGVSALDLVRELRGMTDPLIRGRINSPGGNVFEGVAIFNAFDQHPSRIEMHIDGLAASVASVIALAGDEVTISKNGFLMIHEPSGFAFGRASTMRKTADTLDKIGTSMVGTYTDNSKLDEAEVRTKMAEETWYSADEAKAAGFVDVIVGETDDEEAEPTARFDLSRFHNAPQALSCDPISIARGLEQNLREAGMSRSEAKAVAIHGFLGLRQREADDDAQREAEVGAVRDLATRMQGLVSH